MGQLNNLTIKGFKSIQCLEDFELSNLNLLIGANGVGKTNFVDFFRLLNAMMKLDGLKQFVGENADVYLYGGPKETRQIEVKLDFGANAYSFALAPTQDGRFLINEECRYYHGSPWDLGSGNLNPALLTDKDKCCVTGSDHGVGWHVYEAINSWQIYHFHDTSIHAGMRRFADKGHNKSLDMDASNIAPFLWRLKKAKYRDSYEEILDAVRLVIPFFDDFILEPNSDDNLRLNWRQKGLNDYPMRPSQLSDGSIRFICLATALLQPNPPSTIIIDEPELGLHPQAITILAELIKSASKRTQIIVSTQSPALIDNFSIEDIIVANRDNGATSFKRLDGNNFTAWLENYSVGELWTKNVITGGPVHE